MKSACLMILAGILFSGCTTLLPSVRRQQAVAAHPEWSQDIKQDVLNGALRMGMTPEQVEASWGRPADVNSSGGRHGSSAQWIYNGALDQDSHHYLYFRDGFLESWQD